MAESDHENTWPRDHFTGPGGGAFTGLGGGMYTGPGGGAYTGPGGGMYTGECAEPYRRNMPPWHILIEYLDENNMREYADLIRRHIPRLL